MLAKGCREFRSPFLGTSRGAVGVRDAIVRAAAVDVPVLILGESGVGKELVAREVHTRSGRRLGAFIPVNCSAIPESLIETELFGHVTGAFTDARSARRGAFELADGGVLFLDEVGDLSPMAQPKLLRAIELGEVRPVGQERANRIDLRVIAATNKNLDRMRNEGDFRTDLYYRLDVLEILIPPLRERPEDIRELAEYLGGRIVGGEFPGLTAGALELLESHSWPGNVRELRAALERALALNRGTRLDESCFSRVSGSTGLSLTRLLQAEWRSARRGFERAYVAELMRRHDGDVRQAARAAKISTRSVYKILKRVGLGTDGRHD